MTEDISSATESRPTAQRKIRPEFSSEEFRSARQRIIAALYDEWRDQQRAEKLKRYGMLSSAFALGLLLLLWALAG